jgi:hypothetical protein
VALRVFAKHSFPSRKNISSFRISIQAYFGALRFEALAAYRVLDGFCDFPGKEHVEAKDKSDHRQEGYMLTVCIFCY